MANLTNSYPGNNSPLNAVDEQEMEERKGTALIFGIFSTIGVLMNGTPLILTYATNLRHHFVNIFISNLSLADFLLSAYFLFWNTFYVLYREQMPVLGCRLLGFFVFVAAYQEFVFPPLLSINRYISLYHHGMYRKVYTQRNMGLIVGGSWIACAIMPLVFFLFHRTGRDWAAIRVHKVISIVHVISIDHLINISKVISIAYMVNVIT